MQIRAVSSRDAFSRDELNQLVDLELGRAYTLWAVSGHGDSMECLASSGWGERVFAPSWWPIKAFEVFDLALPPHWRFAIATERDWVLGDEYFVADPAKLFELLDRDEQAVADFHQYVQASLRLEQIGSWRRRVDKVRNQLTPDEVVQALALIEAAELDILSDWLEQLET